MLKIPSFNNYKLIVKDINPQYISSLTMNEHFESMRQQCPNLLEQRLNQYKKEWSQYLRYKNLDLKQLTELIDKVIEKEKI